MKQVINKPAASGWRITLQPSGYKALRWRVERMPLASKAFAARVAARKAGVPLDRNGWVPRDWVRQHYVELGSGCPKPKCYGVPYRPLRLLGDEDYIRASQDAICGRCGKSYGRHPNEADVSIHGHPYLNILCDGTRVKL